MLPARKKLITYGSRKRKRKPLLRPTVPTNPTPQVRTTIAPTPTTTSTTTTTTTTTSKTSSVSIQKKPKLQQLFLDFGQKSFSRVKCKECGMMYAPGRDEDEAAHRLFHRQSSQPVKLRPRDQDTCCWSGREQRRILQFSLDQRENAHRTASLRRRMEEQLTTRTAVDEHEYDRDDEDEEDTAMQQAIAASMQGSVDTGLQQAINASMNIRGSGSNIVIEENDDEDDNEDEALARAIAASLGN